MLSIFFGTSIKKGLKVPREARLRAARCRERARECLLLAEVAEEPGDKQHYEILAETYLTVANAEDILAEVLRKPGIFRSPYQAYPDQPANAVLSAER